MSTEEKRTCLFFIFFLSFFLTYFLKFVGVFFTTEHGGGAEGLSGLSTKQHQKIAASLSNLSTVYFSIIGLSFLEEKASSHPANVNVLVPGVYILRIYVTGGMDPSGGMN